MKEQSLFFNPFRMLSPTLDSEAIKIEELHKQPISESFTLEEGLLVMISKVIEISHINRRAFIHANSDEIATAEALAKEVHEMEKILTANLACSVSLAPELCRAFMLFPGHLERIGDFLESILNCCRIKSQNAVPFTEKATAEIDHMFTQLSDMTNNFRDALIRPNKYLLQHIIEQGKKLDQMEQDLELAHIERLLEGSAVPQSSSLYLDILESSQSVNRHIRQMAHRLLALAQQTGEAV